VQELDEEGLPLRDKNGLLLSEYERQRLATIRENQRFMAQLDREMNGL